MKRKRDFRKSQSGQREIMLDVSRLGLFGAQEFPPGGQISKKLADFHARPRGCARGLDLQHFSGVDGDSCPFGRIAITFAGKEGKAADAGNARQRLAPKTHGGNGRQVLGALNFTGRMPLEGKQRIIAAHPCAVVGHADEAAASGLHFDRDARCPRVEGILDEFFDHTGRTLHYFPGGDLIRHVFGQESDAVHLSES